MSSLTPEELLLGTKIGGGVRMRSSKLFQKLMPAEFLMAWVENALEDRRVEDPSLSKDVSSIAELALSAGPDVIGPRLGDGAAEAGCEG